jgi:lysophospholipase L1-like esterase
MHSLQYSWVIVILALLALVNPVAAQELAEIIRLSTAFETARISGDEEASRESLLEGATLFDERGNAAGPLAREMGIVATKLRQSGKACLESVRVVSRDVAVQPHSAVVTELIGASADVPQGSVIEPRRRTIVWVQSGDTWKIAHIHSSPYSCWERPITLYEEQDPQQPPKPEGIVFVGSSSIVGWKTLKEDFPAHNVIGRGFGGSQLIDSVLYAHRIVTPYRPRAVVVYAGENDVAAGKSAEQVFQDFRLLVETIHEPLPQARIGFIALKPSIQRWQLWPEMKRANALIEGFAIGSDLVDYLDIASPMLGSDARPKHELFLEDGLHLNSQGYALWTAVVKPWLETLD